MVTLRKMTQEEFAAWRLVATAEYAAEHVRAGNWNETEADENARKTFKNYLPNGLDTEGHYLYRIVADSAGEPVGCLWYCLEPGAAGPQIFIADIRIDKAHRRNGYATAVLKVLEKEAAACGAHAIRLHVFGDNVAARKLYSGLGYRETDVRMVKAVAA